MSKVLIWGMGSIGQRHAANFSTLGTEVAVCSQRPHEKYKCYLDISDALKSFVPDHIVVCNETSKHKPSLDQAFYLSQTIKSVLVEKPLYDYLPTLRSREFEDKVKVAYNMRFHPLLMELRKHLSTSPIIGWSAYVGQNLAYWRPGRDYRQVYSSRRAEGGGSIRDLSHEIDMFQFITGHPTLLASAGGKVSSLETDTDDIYSLILESPRCAHANIHLNCVDHLSQRTLIVHTNTETIVLDFVAGTWRDRNGMRSIGSDRNESYVNLARAFLRDDPDVCSFDEGWRIGELIEEAEGKL